jgi:basic membrane lipoprotein Med (substrate-binding protein (PBP1-ABC) superfamily)
MALVLFALKQRPLPRNQGSRSVASAAKPLRIAVVMPSSTTDMAFSQSMWQALQNTERNGRYRCPWSSSTPRTCSIVPDAAAALRDYASQGFDIVIGHGSQYGSSIREDCSRTSLKWYSPGEPT